MHKVPQVIADTVRTGVLLCAGLVAGHAACAGEPAFDFTAAADYSAQSGGLAVLVMQGGVTIFERYDNGHDAATAVHLHSATKAFWGPAAAAMVEDGLMVFDELAADTLTEWQDDPLRGTVTIRQLLDLSSGLSEDEPALQGLDGTAEDKYAYAVSLPNAFVPGERFRYGPSQYYAFGEIMKRKLAATDHDPLSYLAERIFAPIGLTYADWERDSVGNPHIPNGAYLTASEWVKFGRLVLQAGWWNGQALIDQALMDAVLAPSQLNPGHGLAVWLNALGGWNSNALQAPPGSPGGFLYPPGYTDMVAAVGGGKNRMFIFPSLDLVVLRQAKNLDESFADDVFLAHLFGEDYQPVQADAIQLSSPLDSYIDPEFLQSSHQMAFLSLNAVWLGDIDSFTGEFISTLGRDVLIDNEVASTEDTFSGPEFGLDADGTSVVYDREVDGLIQIWRATVDGDVVTTEPLTSGEQHQTARASKDPLSGSTRMMMIRGDFQDGIAVWIDEDDPGVEHIIGEFDAVVSGSWVRGTRQIIFRIAEGPETGQLVLIDTESGTNRTITDDAGDKVDPYTWYAPEYGAWLTVAVVDDQELAIYRDTGGDFWTRIMTLALPPITSNTFMGSAEPFVANGKSYISLGIKSADARIGEFDDGEIWVLGVDADPDTRYQQRCDDGFESTARFDPESYLGAESVFIYYNIAIADEIIEMWRCRTDIATTDLVAPAVLYVDDGGAYTTDPGGFSAAWQISDPDMRVQEFQYRVALGGPEGDELRGWTSTGLTPSVDATGMALEISREYIMGVRARFADNYWTTPVYSDGVILDDLPPVIGGVFDDGQYAADASRLAFSWSASDPGSGIDLFEYQIGTTAGAGDLRGWSAAGNGLATEFVAEGLALDEGISAFVSLRATDFAGGQSTADSNGITVDTEAPAISSVDDGDFVRSTEGFAISWAADDPVSGVEEYRYALGSAPGLDDVLPWASNGLAQTAVLEGLALQNATIYYATVEARDRAGNLSVANGDGVTVDTNAPVLLLLEDDGEFVAPGSPLGFRWETSDETGIAEYTYAFGTAEAPGSLVDWTSADLATEITLNGITLVEGASHILQLKAIDHAGNLTFATTDGLRVDSTAPTIGAVLDDGQYTPDPARIAFSWNASDVGSGITQFEYRIGTEAGEGDVRGWSEAGTGSAFTAEGLALQDGIEYFVTLRATDGVGAATTASSNGITVDTAAPVFSLVDDGDYIQSTESFAVSWAAEDPVSGIEEYRYALGSAPGMADIVPWTSNGPAKSALLQGLSLEVGATYFLTVDARDRVGNVSLITSDGVTIDNVDPWISMTMDEGASTTNREMLRFRWRGVDAETAVASFMFAVGTNQEPTLLQDWTETTNSHVQLTGLRLTNGTSYVLRVYARDLAGNISETYISDGILAELAPPNVAH